MPGIWSQEKKGWKSKREKHNVYLVERHIQMQQHVDDGICGKEAEMVVKVQCPNCPKLFRYQRNMLQHKKEHHPELKQNITKMKKPTPGAGEQDLEVRMNEDSQMLQE